MFYEDTPEQALRFGDVLRGYLSITPIIEEPMLGVPIKRCNIDVDLPQFCVVMDPCCRTRNKTISLTPLIKIWGTFFDNPYLEADLTRINRMMEPQQTLSSSQWDSLPQEEKTKRLAEGRAYAFFNLFVYAPHEWLPRYLASKTNGQEVGTNYYMIDFRSTYKLRCDRINSPTDAPLESKVLQLSRETRAELRDKISLYYAKVPAEDRILED
jgi:hypothetical protein